MRQLLLPPQEPHPRSWLRPHSGANSLHFPLMLRGLDKNNGIAYFQSQRMHRSAGFCILKVLKNFRGHPAAGGETFPHTHPLPCPLAKCWGPCASSRLATALHSWDWEWLDHLASWNEFPPGNVHFHREMCVEILLLSVHDFIWRITTRIWSLYTTTVTTTTVIITIIIASPFICSKFTPNAHKMTNNNIWKLSRQNENK